MIDKIGAGVPGNLGLQNAKNRTENNSGKAAGLNKIESRLADQISLSDASKQNLEQLKELDRQLSRFADVLKGKRSASGVLGELNRENGGIQGVIAGIESRTTLTVSQIQSIQEVTSLSAEINNEGELDLVLNQVRETLTTTNVTLSSNQNRFLAAVS